MVACGGLIPRLCSQTTSIRRRRLTTPAPRRVVSRLPAHGRHTTAHPFGVQPARHYLLEDRHRQHPNVSGLRTCVSEHNLAVFRPGSSLAQRTMESASFDQIFFDFQHAVVATPVRLFDWLDATRPTPPGARSSHRESSGWGLFRRRSDSLPGLNTGFSSTCSDHHHFVPAWRSTTLVTACAWRADLSITKTTALRRRPPGSLLHDHRANPRAPIRDRATVADFPGPTSLDLHWAGAAPALGGRGQITTAAELPLRERPHTAPHHQRLVDRHAPQPGDRHQRLRSQLGTTREPPPPWPRRPTFRSPNGGVTTATPGRSGT